MRFFVVLLCVLFAALPAYSQVVEETSSDVIFTIEHKLSNGIFTPRTKIHLVKKADGKMGLMFPEKNGIFGDDISGLRGLLASNELYTLRIHTTYGNHSSEPVLTSLPACELQKSGFKEDLAVYLDGKQNIMGVSYSTPVSTISRECDSSKIKEAVNFQTKIKLGESVPIQWIPLKAVGARPPNMKDVKLGTDEKGVGETKPKSFLQQYWYVVLIMIIYMFLGGGGAAPEKAADGAAAAGGAAPTTTAATKKQQ